MKQTRQLIITLFISGVAWAASEYSDYLAALSARESSSNPTSVNKYGYLGSYQMGESALIDAGYYLKDNTPDTNDWKGTWTGKNGIHNKADFLANAAVQTQAIKDYNIKQWGYISNLGLDHYVGQTIAGIVMTESGLLAGAHLVGVGGLKTFLQSNGAQIPSDGNKTAITHYISVFNGYNLAPITGNVTAGGSAGPVSPGGGNNSVQPSALTVWQPLINPSTAFTNSTGGVSYQELKTAIQSIIAILLFLWIAFVSWSQFKMWGANSISIMAMKSNIVRATALMMLLLFIFML
ncbi:MAG: TIGR03758 family integrating conjugative element protein [Gammaproteobacteria bacterium]|nr:TIGR03758 family integrating conjugative element protein [Gammaproteobacteria bacterium]